jgi:hypothetical protein
LHVAAVLLALCAGACSNSTVADRPMRMASKPADPAHQLKSYSTLVRGFDRSLTQAEKEAAIADLQKAKAGVARLR